MKKLCFGSYATVLTLCKAQNTSQKVLCGTILLTVAPTYDIRTDDTAVSNLVRCERNLSPNVTDVDLCQYCRHIFSNKLCSTFS